MSMNKVVLNNNTIVWLAESLSETKSNMGYILRDNIGIIFDATYSVEVFMDNIQVLKNGKTDGKYLVISHHHDDHLLGVSEQYCNFDKIYCNPRVAEYFSNADVCVLENGVYPLCSEISLIIAQRCHTITDIMLFDWRNKIAFMGDMLLERRHVLLKFNSLAEWIKVLTEVTNCPINYFVPGHGDIMRKKGLEEYIHYLEFMKRLSEDIKYHHIENTEDIQKILLQSSYAKWSHEENFWKDIDLFFTDRYKFIL